MSNETMTSSRDAEKLIDALIEHWRFWELHESFYINTLAPSLISDPSTGDELEQETLAKLKKITTEDEWQSLPRLLAERRSSMVREIEIKRLEQEAKEKEQREREAKEQQRKELRIAMLRELRNQFKSDFTGVLEYLKETCSGILNEDEFEAEKISFVKNWTKANRKPNSKLPDDQQIAAISSVHEHTQVTARAGSGKTTTLVTRTLFLMRHCRVAPSEILILAFNRKAAHEIRKRLLSLLDNDAEAEINNEIDELKAENTNRSKTADDIEAKAVEKVSSKLNITLPHVMTFHALAYSIVHPEESLLYDESEGGSQKLSQTVQQVIDDHLRIPKFQEKIRNLMLAHFRDDWERIVEGRHDQSKEEFLRFRRSLPHFSLRGEQVKSYGEKLIANFLFEHDITYKYERNHWWNGINYRPDFTVFKTEKSGVIIEYFGLTGDPDYDDMSEKKREYWKNKQNWTLLELNPKDITDKGEIHFYGKIKDALQLLGIPCKRLSEDEIWERIRDRAIDRFTKASKGFIARCRKLSLSVSDLRLKTQTHSALTPEESAFIEIACSIYDAYLNRISATGEEDFDGLMRRATEIVSSGNTIFKRISTDGDLGSLRHICIDEFQDFSDLFYQLLSAIRKSSPEAKLFCVGDDWQAINGFAGSDLKFFKQFKQHVGDSRCLNISTNYRSAPAIVEAGNALMLGHGAPAIASKEKERIGRVIVSDLDEFEPSITERKDHSGDILTPAILRVLSKALSSSDDTRIVLLCRTNKIPYFINYKNTATKGGSRSLDNYLDLIRSSLPKDQRERVTISTAHKYKGLEKKMVIVIDLVQRSYPLIHPDWQFTRILGNSLENIVEEERRLLYVALTRAEEDLFIFTENRNKSPFLDDLERTANLASINWELFPPLQGATGRLVVRIGSQEGTWGSPTYAIKDLLKASGYQWQSTGWRSWTKTMPSTRFSAEILKSEVWSASADGIDVRIFDATDKLVAQFLVDDGNWTCVLNNLKVPSASHTQAMLRNERHVPLLTI
jgi:superfamily I DNA and RNA helicase